MMRPIRWIRDRFSRNIQVRLTGYFLLILLPLVVISLFVAERSGRILYGQAVDRTELALSSAMDYLDLTLQNIEEISTLTATDPNFVQLLNKNGTQLSPQAIVDFSKMLKQLSNVNSVNHIISQITVYHAPSHMMVSTGFGGGRVPSEPQREWLIRTARNNGTGIRYITADEPIGGDATFGSLLHTDSISLVRTMDLYNSSREPNLLIVTLNKNKLQNLIKTLLPSPGASIFLHTDGGRIIAGTGNAAEHGPPDTSGKVMAVTIDSSYSGWRLSLIQSKKELYGETDQLRMYTYLIIAASILMAFGIAWLVYSGIAAPVQKLSHGMKQLGGGKLNFRLENKRKDEFGYLTEAFNQLVLNQKHLIEDHYEQELRLARTELKFLQSQINPHFLYNTLDSIYWASRNYDADEIGEMVLNLSKFFRLSLNKGKDVFPLEESIAHLHYYIRIQQIRFLENFSVEYQLEEESKRIPVLKLLLQPLVENAILHGMEGKSSGGMLVIASWLEEERFLKVQVKDNGPGMPEERLRYIREELNRVSLRKHRRFASEEEEVKDLFGLRNVVTRMRLYYGGAAGLTIESREGEGTCITMSLPLDRCKEELDLDRDGAFLREGEKTG